MDQAADKIEAHIDRTRERLGSNLRELEEKVEAATDWRAHYQARPQYFLGGAFAAGVLLAATVLSVYEPWGMTPYGVRRRREERRVAPLDLPRRVEFDVEAPPQSMTKRPRFALVVAIHAFHAIGLALLLLVMHLAGGGMQSH